MKNHKIINNPPQGQWTTWKILKKEKIKIKTSLPMKNKPMKTNYRNFLKYGIVDN